MPNAREKTSISRGDWSERKEGPAWFEFLWSMTTRRYDIIFEASSNSEAPGGFVTKLLQEEKRYKGLRNIRRI